MENSDWMQRAFEVYGESLARVQGEERKRREQDNEWLAEQLLNLIGVRARPVAGRATVDGIEFGVTHYDIHRNLVMLGDCPHCGELVPSSEISSLETVGQLLTEFRPGDYRHWSGDCMKPQAKQPSAQERLMEALEDLIGEMIDANQG
jgi:hypothetical protein